MKYFLLLGGIVIQWTFATAQAKVTADVKKIYNSDLPSTAVPIVMDCAKSKQKDAQVYSNVSEIENEFNNAILLEHGTSQIELTKRKAEWNNVIEANNEALEREKRVLKSVKFMSNVVLSPIEKVPFYGKVHSEIFKTIWETAESDLEKNKAQQLAKALNEIKARDEKKYFQMMNSGDKDGIIRALDEVQYFVDEKNSSLDKTTAKVVRQIQDDYLNRIQTKALISLAEKYEGQEMKIEEFNKGLSELASFTSAFADSMKLQIADLTSQQELLETQVEELQKEFAISDVSQNYMEVYLYDGMTSEQKQGALKSGFFKELSTLERNRLIKELEVKKQQEKIIQSTKKYLNYASTSLKILDNLGIDTNSELFKMTSEAVSIGNNVVDAFSSFAKQDYLEAVLSVTNIFGNRGPDAATLRHTEVMKYLNHLSDQLIGLREQIDIVIENQQKSYELQLKTIELLESVSDRMDTYHNKMMAELYDIKEDIYYNRMLINDAAFKSNVETAENLRAKFKIDADQQIFPTFSHFFEIAKANKLQIQETQSLLRKAKIQYKSSYIQPNYLQNTYISESTSPKYVEIKKLIEMNKLGSKILFDHFKGDPIGLENALNKLTIPCMNIKELEQKLTSQIVYRGEYDRSLLNSNRSLFEQLIYPRIVIDMSEIARNFVPLLQLMDKDQNPLTEINDLTDNKKRTQHYDILVEFYELNQLTCIQQNLLAGDVLLPIIHDAFKDTLTNNDIANIELLKLNSMLAKNFSTYSTIKALKEARSSSIAYKLAYELRDSALMAKVITTPLKYSYLDSTDIKEQNISESPGWYYKFEDSYTPMPKFQEIAFPDEVKLLQTPFMKEIVDNANYLLISIEENKPNQGPLRFAKNYLNMRYYIE